MEKPGFHQSSGDMELHCSADVQLHETKILPNEHAERLSE